MIFMSEKMAYDGNSYTKPLWQFDTNTYTATHITDSGIEERTPYHSECIRYHVNYSLEHYPKRLEDLVNSGEIKNYLDNMEDKIYDAIENQIEMWKSQDKEYQSVVESGDYLAQARMENLFDIQARDIIYPTMVYV